MGGGAPTSDLVIYGAILIVGVIVLAIFSKIMKQIAERRTKNTTFINKDVWNGLDDYTKGALRGAAAVAEKAGWQKAEELAEWYNEAMRGKGMEVGPPTKKLMSQLEPIGEELLGEWLKKMGPQGKAIIDRFRKM